MLTFRPTDTLKDGVRKYSSRDGRPQGQHTEENNDGEQEQEAKRNAQASPAAEARECDFGPRIRGEELRGHVGTDHRRCQRTSCRPISPLISTGSITSRRPILATAIIELKRVIEQYPDCPKLLNFLGAAYLAIGDDRSRGAGRQGELRALSGLSLCQAQLCRRLHAHRKARTRFPSSSTTNTT